MLKKANVIYRLNIAIQWSKRQTWNGSFFVINENVSRFLVAMKGLPYVKKSDILRHRMAAHVCLKNDFTEDENYHNLMINQR